MNPEFISPGKYTNIRRKEGTKNNNDIWDFETTDDIKKKLELIRPKIAELFEEGEIPEYLEGCLKKTREFCAELSDTFKKEISRILDRDSKKKIPTKIIKFLQNKQFDLPSFKITYKKTASEFLESHGFDHKGDTKKIVLIFQLPKPLAYFWWKDNERINNSSTEWGEIYRELMPFVWDVINKYQNKRGLNFDRLNLLYQHDTDSDSYYYMWEMSEWSHKDETTFEDVIKKI